MEDVSYMLISNEMLEQVKQKKKKLNDISFIHLITYI